MKNPIYLGHVNIRQTEMVRVQSLAGHQSYFQKLTTTRLLFNITVTTGE